MSDKVLTITVHITILYYAAFFYTSIYVTITEKRKTGSVDL